MPTAIGGLFSTVDTSVIYREPVTSGPLNRKFAGVVPPGIHRGFKLVPSLLAQTLTMEADPTSGDHLAVCENTAGYSLTVRKDGDIAVDLSTFAGLTVILALFIDFDPADDTTIAFYKYSVAEMEALSDDQRNELVIFGTVDVPGSAVVIPSSGITGEWRTHAWERQAKHAQPWSQMIRNGGFEWAIPDTVGDEIALYWTMALSLGPASWLVREGAGEAHSGSKSLALRTTSASSSPVTGAAKHNFYAPVVPGDLYKIEFWYKVEEYTTSGELYCVIDLLDSVGVENFNEAITLVTAFADGAVNDWVKFEKTFTVPDDVYWIKGIYFGASAAVFSAGPTDVFRLDDVRFWIEPNLDRGSRPFDERVWKREALNEVVWGGIDPAESGMEDTLAATRSIPYNATSPRIVHERYDKDESDPDAQITVENKGYEVAGSALDTEFHNARATRAETYKADDTGLTFLRELGPATVEAGALKSREYVGSSGERVWTWNALWSGSVWSADDTAYPSQKMVFAGWSNISGSMFERFAFYTRNAGAGTWTDTGSDALGWTVENFKSEFTATDFKTTLAGALELGGAFSTAAQAGYPRLKGGFSETRRLFIEAFAASGVRWRRYTDFNDDPANGDIMFVYNAAWNETTQLWVADDSAILSSMIRFFGGEGPGIRLYTKGGTASWIHTAWTQYAELSATASKFTDLAISMGTPTTVGNPLNTTAVLNKLCAATVLKAYGNVKVASNAIVALSTEGLNFTVTLDTTTFPGKNALTIAFPSNGHMADALYAVTGNVDITDGPSAIGHVVAYNRTTSGFTLLLVTDAMVVVTINTMRIMFSVSGKQILGTE